MIAASENNCCWLIGWKWSPDVTADLVERGIAVLTHSSHVWWSLGCDHWKRIDKMESLGSCNPESLSCSLNPRGMPQKCLENISGAVQLTQIDVLQCVWSVKLTLICHCVHSSYWAAKGHVCPAPVPYCCVAPLQSTAVWSWHIAIAVAVTVTPMQTLGSQDLNFPPESGGSLSFSGVTRASKGPRCRFAHSNCSFMLWTALTCC